MAPPGTCRTMTTIERSIHIAADPTAVYAYVSDVANLPRYFDSITQAVLTGQGEEVHVVAVVPDGTRHEGTAWFRRDDDAQKIEWGSEGGSGYRGWLDVDADESGSEVGSTVRLGLTMEHEDADDSIEKTLALLRSRIEATDG